MLDGKGITSQGFQGYPSGLPPSGSTLWGLLGKPHPKLSYGDRTSCSIINHHHRNMYQPLNVPQLLRAGFGHLPFVLLNTNMTGISRLVRCCYSFDAGSTKLVCHPTGGDSKCSPGCNASVRYIKQEAQWNGYSASGSTGGPYTPRDLKQCLTSMAPWLCHSSQSSGKWCAMAYNEIILDSWNMGGWDLSSVILAVGIAADASLATASLAHEVQRAALLSSVRIPLLVYNSDADRPFALLARPPIASSS